MKLFNRTLSMSEAQETVDRLQGEIADLDSALTAAHQRYGDSALAVETGADSAAGKAKSNDQKAIARLTGDLNAKRAALDVARQQLAEAKARESNAAEADKWERVRALERQAMEKVRSIEAAVPVVVDDMLALIKLADELSATATGTGAGGHMHPLGRSRIFTAVKRLFKGGGIDLDHPHFTPGPTDLTPFRLQLSETVKDGIGTAMREAPNNDRAA